MSIAEESKASGGGLRVCGGAGLAAIAAVAGGGGAEGTVAVVAGLEGRDGDAGASERGEVVDAGRRRREQFGEPVGEELGRVPEGMGRVVGELRDVTLQVMPMAMEEHAGIDGEIQVLKFKEGSAVGRS